MSRMKMLPVVLSLLALPLQASAQATPAPAAGTPPATAQARPAVAAEPTPAFVERAFTRWDTNKDGALSRTEFQNGWASLQRGQRDGAAAALRKQFDSMDRNRNSAIDSDEYSNLVLVKRAGNLAPPMSEFDANRNGRLEFDEYVVLVRKQAAGDRRQAPAPSAASGK